MENKNKSTTWSYLLYLSIKEIFYNFGSTFKISLVVAFIILPLILLHSLGINFLNYAKEDMENRFDLRKIRAIVGNPSRDIVTPEEIEKLQSRKDVSFILPISTRGVQIMMRNGSMEDFDAVASSNDDPTLKRIGASGYFLEYENSLILHKKFLKNVEINSHGEISLVVTSINISGSVNRQYIIRFKIAGTYNRGGGREIYIPIELMDKFDNWRKGYAVPEWKLPGRKDQEVALGPIYSRSVRVFPPYKITEREKKNIEVAKYKYEFLPGQWNSKVDDSEVKGLRVTRKDNRFINKHDVQTIKDILTGAGTSIMVPEPDNVYVKMNTKLMEITSSIRQDPWKKELLTKGKWLKSENKKIQLVVPEAIYTESQTNFPVEQSIIVKDQTIPFQIMGICRGKKAYAHPRTVYRLKQVEEGKAIFDSRKSTFGPIGKDREYVAIYVYANQTEQVHSLESYLQKTYNYVTESYGEMIKDLQITEKRIQILIALLAVAGFLAVILSIAGTMGEAVRRKRRLIGLLRTLGVLKKGVACFFIFQAFMYGVLGIFLACTTQIAITFLLLEQLWIYKIFKWDPTQQWLYKLLQVDPSQHLFWPSAQVWGMFGVTTIIICILAGVKPALSATKFEPGEILSSAE